LVTSKQRNPKDPSWSFTGAVWTYHYLERVLDRYSLVANRIDALLQLNGAFVAWSAAKYESALNKLGSMNPAAICKRDLSRRATDCRWSNALINEGNGVYTAIGDSFSAGLGAGNEEESSNTDRKCRRFDKAYPHLVNNDLKPTRFDFFACSGDLTNELLNSQLQHVDSFSSLVTMTIGGNNVDFAAAVRACVYNECIPSFAGLFGASCCTETLDRVEAKIKDVRSVLSDTFKRVKGWTPFANILTMGYPVFYNVDGGGCAVDSKYRKRMNDLGQKLNHQIEAAAKHAGVAYADPNDAFQTHRFCDTSDAWFFSDRPTSSKRELPHNGKRQIDIVNQELATFSSWTLTFFHPTVSGQAAYARVAEAAINRFPPSKPIGKNWKEEDGDN
jgi:lysophospholipase L1-like esterase